MGFKYKNIIIRNKCYNINNEEIKFFIDLFDSKYINLETNIVIYDNLLQVFRSLINPFNNINKELFLIASMKFESGYYEGLSKKNNIYIFAYNIRRMCSTYDKYKIIIGLVLLHELIHRHQNNKIAKIKREKEARKCESEFLKKNKQRLLQKFNINEKEIKKMIKNRSSINHKIILRNTTLRDQEYSKNEFFFKVEEYIKKIIFWLYS